MFEPSGFRAAEVQFDKDAKVVASSQAVIDLATDNNITDLVVMSHGWNNDIADARDLYTKLAKSLRSVVDANTVPSLSGRRIGLAGVFWPSKKFTEKDLIPAAQPQRPHQLIMRRSNAP